MKRSDLLKAIEYIMPGIDMSNSPLGMDFLVFDQGYLRSFNDVISVSIFTDIPGQLQCAVKAQELYKILTKMEGEQLRLSLATKSLVVKNPKTILQMTLMEEEQLKTLFTRLASLNRDQLKWISLSSEFMGGLDLCSFSAKNDPTLGVLAGVGIKGKYIASTDNKRISFYILQEEIKDEFILPTEVIKDVIKYGKESDRISVTDNWIHFGDKKGLIISTRKLTGEYPFDKVLNIFEENSPDKKIKSYQLPDGLERALDRAEVLAQSDSKYGITMVSLNRSGDFLIIQSGQKDSGGQTIGQIEDKLSWELDAIPEGIEIKISPDFLRKILKITRSFRISPNKNCILFSGEKFQHLIVAKVK